MQLVRLGAGDLDGDTAALVSWVAAAWAPYGDWLLGGRAHAREVAEQWLARESSELSITRVTALVDDDGRHVGGYIAVGGDELPRRRKADLLWLLQHTSAAERRELATRLEQSRGLFAPVEGSHCYLSKLGVLREHRSRGVGGVVVDDFIRAGFEGGYAGLRLDVWADNEPAVRLYRRRGFETTAEAALPEADIRYLAMTLERSAA